MTATARPMVEVPVRVEDYGLYFVKPHPTGPRTWEVTLADLTLMDERDRLFLRALLDIATRKLHKAMAAAIARENGEQQ